MFWTGVLLAVIRYSGAMIETNVTTIVVIAKEKEHTPGWSVQGYVLVV